MPYTLETLNLNFVIFTKKWGKFQVMYEKQLQL